MHEFMHRPRQWAHRPCRHHLVVLRVGRKGTAHQRGREDHVDIGCHPIGDQAREDRSGGRNGIDSESPGEVVHEPHTDAIARDSEHLSGKRIGKRARQLDSQRIGQRAEARSDSQVHTHAVTVPKGCDTGVPSPGCMADPWRMIPQRVGSSDSGELTTHRP